MKIATSQREVETNLDAATTTSFQLGNSAKMFAILSDKIYTDKPRAVIREYAANALDIHLRTGQTKPFFVSLPNRLDATLSIRDFGTGLRKQLVETLFCTYFASDKSGSNLELGGFGLGSKAGFAYTDTFTVTSFQDGIKSTYVCFKGDDGIPQMAEAGQEPTDEPDGLEIKIPVKDVDRGTFEATAKNILQWFPIGSFQLFGASVDPIVPVMTSPTWMTRTTDNYTRHEVLMGPIAYKLDWRLVDPSIELPTSIVPIFQVGELDLPPSREGISYDPGTIRALKTRAAEIVDEVCSQAVAKSYTLQPVARMRYYDELKDSGLYNLFKAYHAAKGHTEADRLAREAAYPLSYKNTWGQYFERKLERISIPAPVSKRTWRSGGYRRSSAGLERTGSYGATLKIESGVELDDAYFIWHDLSEHHAPRVFDRLSQLPQRKRYYLVSPSPKVPDLAALKAILPDMDPTSFITLTDLVPPVKAKKVKSGDTRIYVLNSRGDHWRESYEDNLPTDGLWVPFTGVNADVSIYELAKLNWHDSRPVYGLSKKAQKEVLDDDFERFEDFVKGEIEKGLQDQDVLRALDAKLVEEAIPKDHKRIASFVAGRARLGLTDMLPDACAAFLAASTDKHIVRSVQVERLLASIRHLDLKVPAMIDHHGFLPTLRKAVRKNKNLELLLSLQDRSRTLHLTGDDDAVLTKFIRN